MRTGEYERIAPFPKKFHSVPLFLGGPMRVLNAIDSKDRDGFISFEYSERRNK
jgi:hypothetical protein